MGGTVLESFQWGAISTGGNFNRGQFQWGAISTGGSFSQGHFHLGIEEYEIEIEIEIAPH